MGAGFINLCTAPHEATRAVRSPNWRCRACPEGSGEGSAAPDRRYTPALVSTVVGSTSGELLEHVTPSPC